MRTHQQEITALGEAARNHNVIVAENAEIRKAGEGAGAEKEKRPEIHAPQDVGWER